MYCSAQSLQYGRWRESSFKRSLPAFQYHSTLVIFLLIYAQKLIHLNYIIYQIIRHTFSTEEKMQKIWLNKIK